MIKIRKVAVVLLVAALFSACADNTSAGEKKKKATTVWLCGDSTMTDYSLEDEYMTRRYPMTGWGQVFQQFMCSDSLPMVRQFIKTDSAIVDDRAKGGRSTRSFFEEGRWSYVYEHLSPGDIVMIQFGHNDASVAKGERYTGLPGYKEFLRLYVNQARQKKAIPVLITPVTRNYPWEEGKLGNSHGDYPEAMREVAREMNVSLIDLTELSMTFFTSKGEEYSTKTYFMNLDTGMFEAYPEGNKDNTHFQPAGAMAMANLVFQEMKKLAPADIDSHSSR